MALKRFAVETGSNILLVEDVMTTGSTTSETKSTVQQAGGVVLPKLLVLVNRSDMSEFEGMDVKALVSYPMPMWTPDECPLCKTGSEAIRPKGNWDKLNSEY